MPRRCATREWPNSCKSTQMNSATIMAIGVSAPATLPEFWYPMKAKKARSSKKVQCTLTSMPENRPILKEPPMRFLQFVSRDQIASAAKSAEREAISLHARTEILDLEESIGDGLRLSDQLIQSLLADRAVAPIINVSPVSNARRLSIDEHAKQHRITSLGRTHHEVHVARMEPDRDPSWRLAEHRRVLGERPDARGGPLVQAQPRWLGIVLGLAEPLGV